jgi:hypothetical protein
MGQQRQSRPAAEFWHSGSMGAVLAPGMVFAGCSIQRVFGIGKIGSVYLATDPRLPGPVALKLLHPELMAAMLIQSADVAPPPAYERDLASVPAAVNDPSACHVAQTQGL